MSKILHGGRLKSTREDVAHFTSSIKDDNRLVSSVIAVNKAHIIMLVEQNIINQQDGAKLLFALTKHSNMIPNPSAEDVHMAVEEAVLAETGAEIGGNLHIGKSRNDQVATAIRMTLRRDVISLMRSVAHVQEHLLEAASAHLRTVILEYTHLQPAQPVTFAHYLLSYFDMFARDLERLESAYGRINRCPLGAGALATTSFPINRDRTAGLLGFKGLVENSLDAVSSRDFIIETVADLTLISVTMSRFAEDLIIWSSPDFGVIELPDEFTSTSSIMPQKKNPEVLEVVRARASHVLGNLVAATAIVKSLPSTYNLDFQEVTPKLWDSVDIVLASLNILHSLIPRIRIIANVKDKALNGFVAATELANILVRKYNVPFRTAHKIVGALVKSMIEKKLTFADVTPETVKKAAETFASVNLIIKNEDIHSLADPLRLVESHNILGGPAPTEVKRALKTRALKLKQKKSNISKLDKELDEAERNLEAGAEQTSVTGRSTTFKNST